MSRTDERITAVKLHKSGSMEPTYSAVGVCYKLNVTSVIEGAENQTLEKDQNYDC